MGDAADGAGSHGCAIHDGRVELCFAVRGEDRSTGRVEERFVFKDADGGFDSIERRASAIKHRAACLGNLGERGAIGRVAFRTQPRAVDDARTTVHDDGPVSWRLLLRRLRRCTGYDGQHDRHPHAFSTLVSHMPPPLPLIAAPTPRPGRLRSAPSTLLCQQSSRIPPQPSLPPPEPQRNPRLLR